MTFVQSSQSLFFYEIIKKFLNCLKHLCLFANYVNQQLQINDFLDMVINIIFHLFTQKYLMDPETKTKYTYNREMPLIFIGGMPRSGTTLLRVLLDAHPDIRCGEETRVIPRILGYKQSWMKAPIEAKRLEEAGVTGDVIDSAIGSFILEIIVRHGKPAVRLCNKDPFTIRSAVYLNSLFPNSKFIFIIRDGRAVVHSIISRKVIGLFVNIQHCIDTFLSPRLLSPDLTLQTPGNVSKSGVKQ